MQEVRDYTRYDEGRKQLRASYDVERKKWIGCGLHPRFVHCHYRCAQNIVFQRLRGSGSRCVKDGSRGGSGKSEAAIVEA